MEKAKAQRITLFEERASDPRWKKGAPPKRGTYTVMTLQGQSVTGWIRDGYTWDGEMWRRPCGLPARVPVVAWWESD